MTTAPATITSLFGPICDAHPVTSNLELTFGEVTVTVASNSPALIAKLRAYYADFLGDGGSIRIPITAIEATPPDLGLPYTVKEREPGKTKLKEAYCDLPDGRVVRKLITGLLFFFGRGAHAAVGPCLANDNQIVNFINNRLIEVRLRAGDLLFHAAGVARNGRGLALAGFSGAGKSTLALSLMRKPGLDFVSNDRLLVARTGSGLVMRGVAKMPRVNPGTVLNNPSLAPVMSEAERQAFAALPVAELWDLEHKYDASIDACFGPGRFKLRSAMDGLVVLRWRREPVPMVARRVDLRERQDLMPAFMKDPGVFYEPDDPLQESKVSPEEYLAVLGDVPTLEIEGGVDFDGAVEACLELLENPRG